MTSTPPDSTVARMLRGSRLWLLAGSVALWLLVGGIAVLVVFQAFFSAGEAPTSLFRLVQVSASLQLLVLMVGFALMALTLRSQRRAIEALERGEATVGDVLHRVRRFWRVFAIMLMGASFICCGSLFTGMVDAVDQMVQQVGGGDE